MEKYSKYKIIPELNLLIDYYWGPTDVNDVINLKRIEAKDPDYSPNLDLINDFRDCQLSLTKANVNEFISYAENNPKIVGKRKVAFLTNSPNHVAVTSMYKYNSSGLPMLNDIFSTLAAAVRWLNHSDDEIQRIEEYINQMKNNQ